MIQPRFLVVVLSLALCLILGPSTSNGAPSSGESMSKPPTATPNSVSTLPVPSGSRHKFVYRGDFKPPSIVSVHGIAPSMPPHELPDADAFTLFNHMDDAMDMASGFKHTMYVSTSHALPVAMEFAQRNANTNRRNAAGWVYRIRATANMVDMAASVEASPSILHEREFAALGGVRAADVAEGVRLPANFFPVHGVEVIQWEALVERMRQYWAGFENQEWHWVNEAFREDDREVPRITGHPLLAGLQDGDAVWEREPFRSVPVGERVSVVEYARRFMQRAGAPRGWLADYPMFDEPEALDEAAGFDFGALRIAQTDIEAMRHNESGFFDCTALVGALVTVYSHKHNKRTFLKRHGSQNSCSEANELLRAAQQHPCSRIHNLRVNFKLADESYAGTYDVLKLGFHTAAGRVPGLLQVADRPSAGHSVSQRVDLSRFPGARRGTIEPGEVASVIVTAAGHQSGLQNDEFKLQGITLRAKCLESNHDLVVDKHAAHNAWHHHAKTSLISDRLLDQDVARLSLAPADWRMSPPCDAFSRLQAFLGLSISDWSGTFDALSLRLGAQTVHVGTGPAPGFGRWVDFDVQKAYGKPVVPVREVNNVAIVDTAFGSYWEKDAWKFSEVKVQGTCEGSNIKAEFKVWNSGGQWLHHGPGWGPTVPWSHDIDIHEWKALISIDIDETSNSNATSNIITHYTINRAT